MKFIDPAEFIKKVEDEFNGVCVYDVSGSEVIRDIEDIVRRTETIEADLIEHGHWERYDVDIAEHPYHCSHCGWSNHHIGNRHINEFKFCPECGTKMDEVSDEADN